VGSLEPTTLSGKSARERSLLVSEKLTVQKRAQSLYPAGRIGISTVWVNRPRGRAGSETTPCGGAADIEVPDLTTQDLAAFEGIVGDARVVALGEPTHALAELDG
jgi:hypothetical protein